MKRIISGLNHVSMKIGLYLVHLSIEYVDQI